MPSAVINNPILNSPFAEPSRHWVLDENGIPTGVPAPGRRGSEFVVPVPPAKHKVRTQATLDLDDEYGQRKPNDGINQVRAKVAAWRSLGEAGLRAVTPVTARLLRHWRDPARARRLFFCQIEAAETAIWLAEVAPKSETDRLRTLNAEANPELFRIAFKLATGAGKTTVMGMLIAWQTLNAAQSRASRSFTDAFLVIAPGITIRDRLQVLRPSDPGSIYGDKGLDLVPPEMRDGLQRARVIITNYHAFQPRETSDASKLAKQVLGGRTGPVSTLETEGQVAQRVCKDLLGRRRIVVINDEAHHCYRHRTTDDGAPKLDSEAKAEAKRNNLAARLWITGIESLQRVIGHPVQVYDLSATPFFLRGSGYHEGTLFPWVVSDFSLIDAIECGIVKVPRVPVQDVPGAEIPIYRNVYRHIQQHGTIKLPRAGRGKQAEALDPEALPGQLAGALTALYGHYAKVFDNWQGQGSATPPVLIVVCSNTATSKLVHDWISGYERTEAMPDGTALKVLVPGRLPLLSNVVGEPGARRMADRPCTILIDSEELESGEALSDGFRGVAGPEIEAFKRDLRTRGRHADAEAMTESDLLREVMNTVGQAGRLGEPVRCVVSVSMLTEGWDARTVTHVLGVRAFGTQLLCEQVIGRALRRVSYDPVGHDDAGNGMFAPEYADVLGIPFSFMPANSAADYKPPKKLTPVFAVEGREALEIRFPRVAGYRTILPPGRLTAHFGPDSRFTLTPDMAPPDALNAPVVGEGIRLSLDGLLEQRDATVAFHLAGYTLRRWFRDQEEHLKPWLFPSLLAITRQWMAECLRCVGGTCPAYLLWQDLGGQAAERIYRACAERAEAAGTLLPMMDPYNPIGSSRHVRFSTTKANLFTPRADRCQVNLVVCDGNWEAAAAQELEGLPQVLAYVKNDRLGFEAPYVHAGQEHRYRPDFIAVVDDGRGALDPLHLVVEMKGQQDDADRAKHDTMRRLWVPAVNGAGRFGRWDFLSVNGPYGIADLITRHLTTLAAA